jgi:hypothetical protein
MCCGAGTAVARGQSGRRVRPVTAGHSNAQHAALFLAGELHKGAARQTAIDEPGPIFRPDHGRPADTPDQPRPSRAQIRRSVRCAGDPSRITCRPIMISPNSSKARASCAGSPQHRRWPASSMRKSARAPGGDDADMIADIRARAGTVFHPVSTCRMGPRPGRQCRRPAQGSRSGQPSRVDASVFPAITSGNTNAPTIMVAEKGADMILSDHAGT